MAGADELRMYRIFEDMFMSSSSSSEEDIMEIIDDDVRVQGTRPRIKNYVEDVVNHYTDSEFQQNFRMNRATFEHLLSLVEDYISNKMGDNGRNTIPAKTQLLLSLWYFATPDSYRSICSRFNVGKATGLRIVRRVTDALIEISPMIIKWPEGDQLNEVRNGFNNMGFPDTIGCIDGSYIPIPLPKENGLSYICRKNFPCIVLQAVCDHKLLFTHCYAGEVGSLHDATVLRRSEVWTFMMANPEKFPENSHILGDKAYPLLPQLMVPYKNIRPLNENERNFNYKHAAVRSSIERAFALLKKRFRCMKFLDVRTLTYIPKYIIACCVLHNICILNNDILHVEIDEDNAHDVQDEDQHDYEANNVHSANARRQMGVDKRNFICNNLLL